MKTLHIIIMGVLVPMFILGNTGGGSVSWFSPPRAEPNGWYWMYDDAEPGPPFSDPPVSGLPSFRDITADGSKLAPYNDQPFKYTLPDSFWYYGYWYEPGDYLYISPDGWVSLDPAAHNGFPDPPTASPPFPVTDAPNAIMAALWQDMDPTQTSVPSDDNRVYYMHDALQEQLYVQWYNTQGHANNHTYNFELTIILGGQSKLMTAGACGVVFSYHFVHFLYQSSSHGWTADGGKTGIENPTGTMGITYGGSLVNGRVIRAGYKRVFKHDVQAYVFLSPGGTVLRWTEIQPIVVVRNIGEEVEHFPVTLDIYDENNEDENVYHQIIAVYGLMPGESDTFIGPCWTPGELHVDTPHVYRKIAFTYLDRDECKHNDTLVGVSTVGCDGALGYHWNYADIYGWIGAHQYPLGTTYPVDSGVLVTGGRIWLYSCPENYTYSRLEVWEAENGCGGVADGSYHTAWKNLDTRWEFEWNEVIFDQPVWVTTATPGNIWAAHTSADYGTPAGFLPYIGVYPHDPMACYFGPGPGRSGTWLAPDHGPSSDFKWGAYHGDYWTYPIELYTHLAFSPMPAPPCYYEKPHDLSCYRMEQPSGEYVEADVPITPELAIANIGRQAEPDAEFFSIEFIVVDKETSDTVFHETSLIGQTIGWPGNPADDPDTAYGATAPWTPEGICRDIDLGAGTGPWVEFELIGLVCLGDVGPDESDHCPYNDTIRRDVTCLLSHDVGVIDMTWPEPPDEPPNHYDEGSKITITATIENFGFHAEHDIEVRLEIRDLDSNNVELWHALKNIKFLDWRGNESGNPYTIDVTFPTYDVLTDRHNQSLTCCTELVNDDCPENDYEVRHIWYPGIAEEDEALPDCFALEIPGSTISDGCQVRFAVPHSSWVKLDVFDAGGRWVCSLENDIFEPGRHSCSWDRCDAAGRKVAAGIYLVRMEADGFDAVRKVVVVN